MKNKNAPEKSEFLSRVENHITRLFHKKLPPKFLYHDLNHTKDVVEICEEIGEYYSLNNEKLEALLIAAWFHDIGYIETYSGHEEMSADMAQKFMSESDCPQDKIDEVKQLILSTKNDHEPADLLEEILHDADVSHMGRKRFRRKSELLRLEWEFVLDKKHTDLDFEQLQLDFLTNKNFHTDFAKEKYKERFAKNILDQRSNINKAIKDDTRIKTGKDFGRGVDTLYRVTFRNHIDLSDIADGKANMMISINTIILSVIITLAGSGLTLAEGFFVEQLRFTIPIFVLLICCLSSVVFSILSARPNVTSPEENEDKLKDLVEEEDKSIIFFGNFVHMKMKDFVNGLRKLKEDHEKLYDNMTVDLYYLGHVLQKKYKLLRYSYNIFMVGITLAVLSFSFIFFYTYYSGGY